MAILRKTIPKKSGLLDVGRVEPDVGHWRALERPSVQILDAWSRLEAMALTWFLREPGDAYLLGYPLHLAGARAGGVHLGDGGNEGAVHAPVALDHVVREEAAGAELRDAQRQRAGAGASDLSR